MLPKMHEYARIIVDAALAEDVGPGDITSTAVVPARQRGEAVITAGEDLVVAGLFVAEMVFKRVDKKIEFAPLATEGRRVRKGRRLVRVSGRMRSILTAERVALNFLQRLSGIATLTAGFVSAVRPYRVRLLDTRKTTPCIRMLEKYAVAVGGGYNHRYGLFDGVLIKDNHIASAGSITEAVRRVNRAYPDGVIVEVEVTDTDGAAEAVEAGADIVLLDNMSAARARRAVKLIGKRALVEVSGGVSLRNVRAMARTGADFISIGALTHSARAVDMGMEVAAIDAKGKRRRG